jgi:hypothetical protein
LQCGSDKDSDDGRLAQIRGPVWYNPDGIANIMSLSDDKKHYFVAFNSREDGGCFRVHMDDGGTRELTQQPILHGSESRRIGGTRYYADGIRGG